ncbi:MAG: WecB/TagA/CpsF family glycosyltransferase [Sphingobacteriaceae bacterium]|nr:WecB/TagA/CpsF family glycosyltransferase [Sphingobacteriaceae bacterium]
MKGKVLFLNVGFNPTNYEETVDFLMHKNNRKGYVCFPDLYNVLRANETLELMKIYNASTLTLPDGKPSQYFIKKKGYQNMTTISGYWLCQKLLNTNLSHFFYGTTDNNIKLMEEKIKKMFPKANIIGFKSPPLVQIDELLNHNQLSKEIKEIQDLNPDIIWIGIGSPKQDYLMHYYSNQKEGTIMIGVGAVFDYFAETAHMGPEFLKKIGLRWLYQLFVQPKRYTSRLFYILIKLPKYMIKSVTTKKEVK